MRPRPRRPRVGVDLRALVRRPTGIGIHTQALVEELVRRDAVEVVGLVHAPLHDPSWTGAAGIALEVEPAPLGVLWQQWVLPRRLARGDLDLFWSPLLTLPLRMPVPSLVTVHDLAVLHHPESLTWKIRASLLPFLGRSIEKAGRVLTVSRSVADEIVAVWPAVRDRLVVIPNGVAEEFSPVGADELAAIRSRLGLPERYLLYVGTVEPRKNLEILLDAWERLRGERDDTPPLLVVGPEGWGSRATERRMRDLAAMGLRRLGHLDRADLVDTLRAATIFVYPSYYEGFGLPALEAMACGVPVIVADRSSLPEVVGDCGLQFDPDDANELLAALVRWLDAPEELESAARCGARRARDFTWSAAGRRLEETMLELLAGSRPASEGSS
ncbi:MAG: glycosyltransferase family 4 protein [Thermoanaerobaculia bacterium]